MPTTTAQYMGRNRSTPKSTWIRDWGPETYHSEREWGDKLNKKKQNQGNI